MYGVDMVLNVLGKVKFFLNMPAVSIPTVNSAIDLGLEIFLRGRAQHMSA